MNKAKSGLDKLHMATDQLKIRISTKLGIAIGPGKAELLDAIASQGSISAAAKSMKMSYRRAWELVDIMNKSFDQPMVVTSPGGQQGGGAEVTEFGFLILKTYRDIIRKANKAAQSEIGLINSHLKTFD